MIGTAQLWVDGRKVELRARERMVLAALAVDHPRSVARDVLIDRLWGDEVPATARKALQNHVARLRRAAGSTLVVTVDDGYALAVDATIDTAQLRKTIAATDRSEANGSGDAAPAATELDVPSGEPFADLVAAGADVDAARRRVAADRSALRLAVAATAGPADAVAVLESAVVEDPFAEVTWIELAAAYQRTQRRRDAAQVFSRARAALARAGLTASDQLADAERTLLNHTISGRQRPVVGAALSANGSVLLDAASQARQCDDIVETLQAGASVVVAHGPAGIGKTTVIEAAALHLAASRSRVIQTRCEAQPAVPLEPVADVVAEVLDRAPGVVAALDDAAPLALLGPDVAARVGRGRGVLDPERRRLDAAVVELLTHPAVAPLTLVIDDLHWATRAVTDVLAAAVDRADERGTSLSLLAGWRGPADAIHVGNAAVARVELRGLDRVDVEALLAPLNLDADRVGSCARVMWEATGGNPLFVRELVRVLTADPSLLAGDPHRWFDTLPPTVSSLLEARIAALSPAATEAVVAAAVLGHRQLRSDVAHMAPWGDLDGAVAEGVLRVVDGDSTEFDHDLLRAAVLDSLGPARTVELHDLAVRAIEASPNGADRVPEIAAHAVAAGSLDPLGAALYATQAAEVHERLAHHGEAADILGRGAATPGLVEQWPRRAVELMIGQGAAQLRAGDPAARATLEEAIGRARALDDAGLHARATIELCRLGPTSLSGATDPVAADAVARSLASSIEPGLRAQVAAVAAMVHSMSGDPSLCRSLMEQALADAETDGNPEVLGTVLPNTYMTFGLPDDLARRDALARRLDEIGRAMRRSDLRWEAAQIRFSNALQMGDPAVRNELAVMRRLAAAVQERNRDWQMRYLEAAVHQLDGDLAASEAAITASLDYADSVAPSRVMAAFGVQLLALRLLDGRAGELRGDLDRLVADQPALGGWHAGRAVVAAAEGDVAVATEAFDRAAADGFAILPRDFSFTGSLYCLGRTAADLGDVGRAGTMLAVLEPWAERWSWTGTTTLGPLGEVVADCMTVVGRVVDGSEVRARTRATAERLGAAPYLARLME